MIPITLWGWYDYYSRYRWEHWGTEWLHWFAQGHGDCGDSDVAMIWPQAVWPHSKPLSYNVIETMSSGKNLKQCTLTVWNLKLWKVYDEKASHPLSPDPPGECFLIPPVSLTNGLGGYFLISQPHIICWLPALSRECLALPYLVSVRMILVVTPHIAPAGHTSSTHSHVASAGPPGHLLYWEMVALRRGNTPTVP